MRRRLQRRRAAAANVLAAVNAASVRVQGSVGARATGIRLPEEPLAASNDLLVAMPAVPVRAEFMDEWPSFCELVAPPPGWAGVEAEQQTDPVFVAAAPPVLYSVGTQTESVAATVRDVAVGVNLSERSWPDSWPFELVLQYCHDNALLRPEAVVADCRAHYGTISAGQEHYVLGVVRGIVGGLRSLSLLLHQALAPHQNDAGAFEAALRGLVAKTGEYITRPV